MTAHPGLVSKVSAALAQADRGPLEVSYDTLAAAAVDAVCAWIAEGGQGG
jgi:hypothetical protein